MSTAAWLAEAALTPGEEARYRQGVRLRRLEAAWEAAKGARRAAAIPEIQRAVRGYFAGRAREVSAGLDRAVATLEGIDARGPDRMLADALDITPNPALVDPTSEPIRLRVALGYSPKAAPQPLTLRAVWAGTVEGVDVVPPTAGGPSGARKKPGDPAVRATEDKSAPQTSGGGKTRPYHPPSARPLSSTLFPADLAPWPATFPALLETPLMPSKRETILTLDSMPGPPSILDLDSNTPSDQVIGLELRNGSGAVLRKWAVVVSLHPGADDAIALLTGAPPADPEHWTREALSLRRATRIHARRQLLRLRTGGPLETDRPAAALLAALNQADCAAAAATDTKAIKPADYVRALAQLAPGAATLATNGGPGSPGLVRVGGAAERFGHRDTLHVLALHGAGGSENMFHDAYGLGRLASECRRRGWVLVTAKLHSPGDDLWARMEALGWPQDVGAAPRLVLVGHSMGSLAAVEMARQRPEAVAGVAAISVGSREDVSALRTLPVLVAAGAEDFGRASSRRLYDRLKKAGAPVRWHQPPSEHLMVVADSLAEVIRWIEKEVARPR